MFRYLFSGSRCLEFLAKSDISLQVLYTPPVIQIGEKTIQRLGVTLPRWYIAPMPGEILGFDYLRDLHAPFQAIQIRQRNGFSSILFNREQRIDLYQTTFGLPSHVLFQWYEIETHYSRAMKKLNRTTGI